MTNKTLAQKTLKEKLSYNADTGIFTRPNGSVAGAVRDGGYIQISVCNKLYRAHRLAFLYMEGRLPVDQVDHINRKRDDNRWCNLRHATQLSNSRNMSSNTDFLGVNWDKRRNKWLSIGEHIDGKNKFLGRFKTHLAACYARHYYEICNPV